MADIEAFDPEAFAAFKSQASGAQAAPVEAFDPDAYAAFKVQQSRPAPEPSQAQQLAAAKAATASPYVEGGLPDMPSSEDLHRQGAGVPTSLYAGASSAMDSIPVVGPMLTGASDRLAAGIRSYRDGTAYGDELKRIQDYDAGAKAVHPVASTVGGVAGGIAGTAPMIMAAPALFGAGEAALPARLLASTVSGSVLGGADAAVRTGGDPIASRNGALVGGGLGVAAPVLGAAVGAGVRRAGEFAAGRLAPTAGFGSAAAGKLADDVAASGGADAVRARLGDLGTPAMLMDASPAFTGRAQGLAVEPATRGAIVTPLETRATGANARIRGDVDQTLGPAAEPAMVEAARQQSYDATVPPLYRQATGQPVQVDTSNVLGMVRDLRSQEKGPAADALDRAWNLLHHDGDVPGVGRAMIPDRRPEALHNAKEALDASIAQAQGQMGSAAASTVNRLGQVRGALNDTLEAQVPGYRDANQTAQQYFAGRDAFARGQTLLSGGRDAVRPGQLAADTAGMSPMEIFMQRTGLRSEVDRHLGTTLNDRVALQRDLMGEGDFNRARMATVFGEESTQRLANTVGREAQFDRTYNDVVRGSQTAQRAASARDIAPREVSAGSTDVLPGLATILGGADAGASALATKAGMGGLKLATSAAGRQADLARNQQLARAVTMEHGDALNALLDAIERRGRMMQQVGGYGNAAAVGTQAGTISQADRARGYLPSRLPALPFVGR
ncbi:hypothetical protein MKK84_11360 [Methylobacterium sp. E-065]|uniref:hypothetical protein n=1 Tax=Methylobacterium sp. E-065 TaxID=2836583 RepID=UPI001FBB2587|nr:hypothetical protein [Methylobacterium sp. E-065]MCJ2018017.1 hypothetical protein [Methylobacterium sp. E-065]